MHRLEVRVTKDRVSDQDGASDIGVKEAPEMGDV